MGFYIRKSVSLGPLRLNLSKSGVGFSVGVKGLRVGTGPRGNYIHISAGGLSYRSALPKLPVTKAPGLPKPSANFPSVIDYDHEEIESASTHEIVDSNSQKLVLEINEKLRKFSVKPVAIGLPLCVMLSGVSTAASTVSLYLMPLLYLLAWYVDRIRKTTVILYDFDEGQEKQYQEFCENFEQLRQSKKTWHIPSRSKSIDIKYTSGAKELVSRKSIGLALQSSDFLKTNIPTPTIPVGKQKLVFLPEKLLVIEKNQVGAVSYENLSAALSKIHFVETESVPRDSIQVDRTWQYVNKKGGPDKRFKENRELPVMEYAQLDFQSQSGLYERIMISNVVTSREWIQSLEKLTDFMIGKREQGTSQ